MYKNYNNCFVLFLTFQRHLSSSKYPPPPPLTSSALLSSRPPPPQQLLELFCDGACATRRCAGGCGRLAGYGVFVAGGVWQVCVCVCRLRRVCVRWCRCEGAVRW
eukprot:GHVS01013026.1.p1 GENE.GHVS01013026.1~~GHVS01013026.1.p1  ORF type:complete len:105 (-),score=31.45 GHVS01013026.1:196-510(-)